MASALSILLLGLLTQEHWHWNLFGRHGQSRTTFSGGTALDVKYRTTFQAHKSDFSLYTRSVLWLALKYAKMRWRRTPLGELTTLPGPSSQLGGGHEDTPSPHLPPLRRSLDAPSAYLEKPSASRPKPHWRRCSEGKVR